MMRGSQWASRRRLAVWVVVLGAVAMALGGGNARAVNGFGAGATKGCNTNTLVGQPMVCHYGYNNLDDFGNTYIVTGAQDVVQTAGGAVSSGNILSSLSLVFHNSATGGTVSCVGGSGSGTAVDPYIGATSCT